MDTITAILEPDADGTLHLPLPDNLRHGKVRVVATLESEPENAAHRGQGTALAALGRLRARGTFRAITDPAAWQREMRQDRPLIGLLNRKLTPNDPHWMEFGLKAPGAAVTPHAPEHLENHPALAKQLHATCGAVPGADYYRWFLLLPGGTAPVFQQDTADPEVLLENLTSGQTVQLTATAVNPARESVPSQPLAVVVG